MESNKILNVAGYAGRILLESGAEAYRVEETMVKMCESFGVEDAQSFVTTTGVMMSITHGSQNYAKISRITKRGTDLHKIDLINDLSRNIRSRSLSIDDVHVELHKIDQEPRYSYHITLICSALSAFGFAGFFKGTLMDAMCALIIGMLVKFVSLGMSKNQVNVFFDNAISAGVAALLALTAQYFGLLTSLDIVIISSIMLLVPGLAITNAIRDTVAGDYLAGVSRAAEAFLIAIAIAVGIAMVFQMWNMIGGL